MTTPRQNAGIERALVLGGGGPVGRAWLAGLITGLRDEGVDLGQAELIVGTSAGAVAGAQFALGLDLVAIVTEEAGKPGPLLYTPAATARLGELLGDITASNGAADPDQARAAIGAKALAVDTISEDAFLARPMYAPLVGRPWPSALRATAVSTSTGRLAVWSEDSDVDLFRAVASSTSLPGISPAVTINGDRYMDGGVRSMLNADLAAGARSVIVVSCFSLAARSDALTREFDAVTAAGGSLTIVEPGQEQLNLSGNGAGMLDITLIPDALEASRRQAKTEATRLAALA
jgi:NTE family protein